jgi:hypothetical protein
MNPMKCGRGEIRRGKGMKIKLSVCVIWIRQKIATHSDDAKSLDLQNNVHEPVR